MILLIGDIIKHLREERDIQQQELAKFLNIGKSTLSQYENGLRFPNDEIKKKISNYFNVSIDYLLEMTSIPDKIDNYIQKDANIKETKIIPILSEDEQNLITNYRNLSEQSKSAVKIMVKSLLTNEEQIKQDA